MLDLNAQTTALVIVDLQKGILALPMVPHMGAEVMARSIELGCTIAAGGGTVVLVTVDYADHYADRPSGPADAPLDLPPDGLPADWAELAPEIAALPARVRIIKRQHSAFFGTELDLQLRRRGVNTVIITGLATNFGVEGTARDAFNLNYAVLIAADACSSTAPGLHEFAVEKILPRIARVRTTAELIRALGKEGRP